MQSLLYHELHLQKFELHIDTHSSILHISHIDGESLAKELTIAVMVHGQEVPMTKTPKTQ